MLGAQPPKDPQPAAADNERGFWESQAVIQLNEEILSAYDSAWNDVFAGRPRHHLSNFNSVFQHKATDVLDAKFGQSDLIVVKEPRINVLCAFWDKVLRKSGYDPTYIIMVRNPLEVAASLRERDELSTERGLMIWLDQMIAAERDTREARRVFVAYDDLLADWRHCIDRIEAKAGDLPRRTSSASNTVEQFLSPGLRHHRLTQATLAEPAPIWRIVEEVYGWFVAQTRDDASADARVLELAAAHVDDLHRTVGPIMSDYQSKVDKYRTHAIGLEQVVDHLRERLETEVKSGLVDQDLGDALQAATDELHSVQAAEAEMRQRLQDATLDVEETRRQLLTVGAEADHVRGALEASRYEAAQAHSQVAEAQSRTKLLEDELRVHLDAEAQSRLVAEGLGDALKAATEELHSAQAAEAETRQRLEHAIQEVEETRRKLLAVSADVEHGRNALEASREELAQVHSQVAEAQSRTKLVEEELRGAVARHTSKETYLNEMWHRLEAEKANLAHELDAVQAQTGILRDDLEQAKADRGQAEAENRGLLERHGQLDDEILRLQRAAEVAFARNHRLEADSMLEKSLLSVELNRARRDSAESRRHATRLQDDIEALNTEAQARAVHLEGSRVRLTELEQDNQRLVDQRDAIFSSRSWRLISYLRRIASIVR